MWSRRRAPTPRRDDAKQRRDDADPRSRQRHEHRLRAAERSLARGRSEQAVRQALDLAAESPKDLARLNRIGDLLVRADRIAPGVELFERVGQAYADDGFWAKAIAIYKKILRYDPRRADVRTRLAFLYQRSGLPTGAPAG
jgi:tetratricopeptide (TPR) repeat protein